MVRKERKGEVARSNSIPPVADSDRVWRGHEMFDGARKKRKLTFSNIGAVGAVGGAVGDLTGVASGETFPA